MSTFDLFSYTIAVPEFFLAGMAMLLLMMGVFVKEERISDSIAVMTRLTFLGTLGLVLLVWQQPGGIHFAFPRLEGVALGYSAMYILDDFAFMAKVFILFMAFAALYLSGDYLTRSQAHRFEYYILHMLSVLGMLIMASANDMLMLYVGLELMSFCLYILASFQSEQARSTEAGLKYFVLGSLASGVLLFGISLLYGLTGDTSFSGIQAVLVNESLKESMLLNVSLVLILTGLAFKISAVPFHMWTPDVYEGSPTPVTSFMAVVVKIAAFALLIRVLFGPLSVLVEGWDKIIMLLAVLTMGLGSFLAIVQNNLKRLMAYSSISHVGFMLVGLSSASLIGVQGVLFYLVIYGVMTLGAFAVLLCLQNRNVYLENISDLAGLAKTSPWLGGSMAIFMLSMAGVPPLAGFWAKFYVFRAAVEAGHIWLTVVAVSFSVVAAYYALRVVKTIFFDEGEPKIDPNTPFRLKGLVYILAFVTLLLGLFPDYMATLCRMAASSLF